MFETFIVVAFRYINLFVLIGLIVYVVYTKLVDFIKNKIHDQEVVQRQKKSAYQDLIEQQALVERAIVKQEQYVVYLTEHIQQWVRGVQESSENQKQEQQVRSLLLTKKRYEQLEQHALYRVRSMILQEALQESKQELQGHQVDYNDYNNVLIAQLKKK